MVPEGMAYAGIVGVPPIMGLYPIVPALLAYALLGTSRQLVVRPDPATGLISALTSGAVAALYRARHPGGARGDGCLHNLDRFARWRVDRCARRWPHPVGVAPPNGTTTRRRDVLRASARCARHCAGRLRGGARCGKC